MLKYIIKRILASIATIIGIIFLINLFIELAPGDPGLLDFGHECFPGASADFESFTWI